MHARVTTVRTRPGAAEPVADVWRGLLDAYGATPVFHGLVPLYDEQAQQAVTLTLWSSEEEADVAAAQLRPLAVAAFGDLLVEAPQVVPYDVLLIDTRTP